jgi:hypothetical protein
MGIKIGDTITINDIFCNGERDYEVIKIDSKRDEYTCVEENNFCITFCFTGEYIERQLIKIKERRNITNKQHFCLDDNCGNEVDFEDQVCSSCLDEVFGNVHKCILGRNITTTDVHDFFNFNFEVIEVKNGVK